MQKNTGEIQILSWQSITPNRSSTSVLELHFPLLAGVTFKTLHHLFVK